MIVEAMAVLLALAAPEPARSRLPGTVAGNVVILTPEDESHRQIRILVDSGGYDLIESDAATRLGLSRTEIELGGNKRETAAFPRWNPPSPEAPATTRWLIARPGALHDGFAPAIDATFGPSWMLDHPIAVDYPHETIQSVSAPYAGTPVPLTVGVGRASIPSLPPTALVTIDVTIAGEPLTLLLDTGATARVRDPVKRLMPDKEPVHQVCLIEMQVLERWRRAHPAWTYAEAAFDVAGDKEGAASPAILVPELRIANQLALPTWFIARRDASTFATVSKQMRRTVVGDLGGDALRRWRVTFDLKNERLLLE
ncbi:MAG: hypothetical protein JWM87_483 [Candidatus Eremiobacteraeota bacterium]|nr:hypothetical protein [Candidatus Eremiobacteraeota bacterium]